jgi:hypothetical protein
MRDSTEVYRKTISITAPVGGVQSFSFPPFKATRQGVITWTVTIADPTPDTATATTTVYRGAVPRSEREMEKEME